MPGQSSTKGFEGSVADQTFNCTACGEQVNHKRIGGVSAHSVLNVLICRQCKDYYGKGKFTRDENGSDEYCRWCAEGGRLVCCDACPNAFCESCIRRNLGRGELRSANSSTSWSCFVCEPDRLRAVRKSCEEVLAYQETLKSDKSGMKKGLKMKGSENESSASELDAKRKQSKKDRSLASGSKRGKCEENGRTTKDKEESSSDSEPEFEGLSGMLHEYIKATGQSISMLTTSLTKTKRSLQKHHKSESDIQRLCHKLYRHLNITEKNLATVREMMETEMEQFGIGSLGTVNGDSSVEKSPMKAFEKPLTPGKGPKAKRSLQFARERDRKSDKEPENKVPDIGPDVTEQNGDVEEPVRSQTEIAEVEDENSDDAESQSLLANADIDLASIMSGKSPYKRANHMNNDSVEIVQFDNGTEPRPVNEDSHDSEDLIPDTPIDTQTRKKTAGVQKRKKKHCSVSRDGDPLLDSDSSDGKQTPVRLHFDESPTRKSRTTEKQTPTPSSRKEIFDIVIKQEPADTSPAVKRGKKDLISVKIKTEIKDETFDNDQVSVKKEKVDETELKVVTKREPVENIPPDESPPEDVESVQDSVTRSEREESRPRNDDISSDKGAKSKSKPTESNDVKESTSSSLKALRKTTKENEEAKTALLLDMMGSDESDEEIGRMLTPIRRQPKKKQISSSKASEEEEENYTIPEDYNPENDRKLRSQALVILQRLPDGIIDSTGPGDKRPRPSSSSSSGNESDPHDKDVSRLTNLKGLGRKHCEKKPKADEAGNSNKPSSKQNGKKKNNDGDSDDFFGTSDEDDGDDERKKKDDEVDEPPESMFRDSDSEEDEERRLRKIDPLGCLKNRNDMAREMLQDLLDSDSSGECDDEASNQLAQAANTDDTATPKKTAKKVKKNKESSEEDEEQEGEDNPSKENGTNTDKSQDQNDEPTNDDDTTPEKQAEVNDKSSTSKKHQSALLRLRLSESDSDLEEEKAKKALERKKNKKDRGMDDVAPGGRRSSQESPKKRRSRHLLSETSSEDEKSEEEKIKKKGKKKDSDEDVTFLSDSSVEDKKKKKKVKKKAPSSSSEDDTESETEKNNRSYVKGKGKKRRRIKQVTDSEGSDNDNKDDTPSKGGRKNIRKIMKDSRVGDETKAAAKEEEERRRRVTELQKLYNVVVEEGAGEGGCSVTTKLVLEKNSETEETIIEVHPLLIRKLKPHQVDGVKFLWASVVESMERLTAADGSGCILAHCMGLGKTLQVIAFLHTLLFNEEKTKVRTALVVCPLNTVMNWFNEVRHWLSEDELDLSVDEMASVKQNWHRLAKLRNWQEEGGIMIMGYEMFRLLVQEKGKRMSKKLKTGFQETLIDPGPDIIVCDEGHVLKNEKTALSKAMTRIRTKKRIVLTGTPLQNNLTEYHCMVDFVKPNLLGTMKEFCNRFVNPIMNGSSADATAHDVRLMKRRAHILHNLLDGCVQRRDYTVLTPFLPPKHEYVISVQLSELQVKLYQHYLDNHSIRVLGGMRTAGTGLFADYQSLSKIWSHPWVLRLAEIRDDNKVSYDSEDSFIDDESFHSETTPDSSDSDITCLDKEDKEPKKPRWQTRSRGALTEPEEPKADEPMRSNRWWSEFVDEDVGKSLDLSGKLVLLFDILRECEAIGDKVLLFSQSLLSLDLIEDFLQRSNEDHHDDPVFKFSGKWYPNMDYFRMDGSINAEKRNKWIQIFNDEENFRGRLFLISTRAGSLGTNLVAANRVIVFDASWNPTHDVQSIFRVYRFGQKKPVYIYRFLAQGTMEDKIYDRQVSKLSLSCRVVDEQQIERHFNASDLQELYTFTPDIKSKRPTPALPKDRLLAEMLIKHKNWISGYHEHDSLLENKEEEVLTEEERKAAWDEYEAEKQGLLKATTGLMQQQPQQYVPQYNMNTYSAYQQQAAPDLEQIARLIQEKNPNISFDELVTRVQNTVLMLRNIGGGRPSTQPTFQLPQMQVPAPSLLQQQFQQPTHSRGNQLDMLFNQAGGAAGWQQQETNWQQVRAQQQAQQMIAQQQLIALARQRNANSKK